MKNPVCIESNSLTYLVDAMCGGNEPKDNLANEKKALLRTYLYRDKNLYVPPSVKEEYEKIKNKKNRQNHQEIADLLIDDILSVDLDCVDSRSQEYSRLHKGEKIKWIVKF